MLDGHDVTTFGDQARGEVVPQVVQGERIHAHLRSQAPPLLDPRSEADVIAHLSKFNTQAARIVVSHRLSMVRTVDLIAVLEDGGISEFGTPDELLTGGGAFHELFTLQASAYQTSERANVNA